MDTELEQELQFQAENARAPFDQEAFDRSVEHNRRLMEEATAEPAPSEPPDAADSLTAHAIGRMVERLSYQLSVLNEQVEDLRLNAVAGVIPVVEPIDIEGLVDGQETCIVAWAITAGGGRRPLVMVGDSPEPVMVNPLTVAGHAEADKEFRADLRFEQ